MSTENREKVHFVTSPSTWMRYEQITGKTLRATEPYNRIVSIKFGEKCLNLFPAIPESERSDEHAHHTVALPTQLVRRLGNYATQLLANESHRAKTGNCHDFTALMLGHDFSDWKKRPTA